MDISAILQHCISGITVGSMYALIAIGYTMVYGILRLINFAHGDVFMVAAYLMVFSMTTFYLPWYVAVAVVVVMTALVGMLMERTAYRPLRDAPRSSIMISAIGMSYLLENLATYFFTGRPKAFPEIKEFTETFNIGSLSLQPITIITPVVTLLLLGALVYLVQKTKLGMAMRAVSKDYETARLMGIKINTIISITFAIGSGLAAVGAVLWGSKYPQVQPLMGVMPGLKCFIAAVIGGIGNIKGAVLGGFILGVAEVLIVALFSSLTGYRDAFAFVILIIVLLIKPTGLLGEKTTEKV